MTNEIHGRHEAVDNNKNWVVFSNNAYNILKWVAQIALPGIGAFYFTIAQIWGLPAAEEVVGTIVAVDALLGVLLGISAAQYKRSDARFDGALVVDTSNPAKDVYRLDVDTPLGELPDKSEITLKVLPGH